MVLKKERNTAVMKLSEVVAIIEKTEPTLEVYKEMIIQYYLIRFDGDVLKTAYKLKIGKSSIYRMLDKGKINKP